MKFGIRLKLSIGYFIVFVLFVVTILIVLNSINSLYKNVQRTHDHLSITDTGCGITDEDMKKLFEPLFTTKARGIGLGLSVTKNLLEVNGGKIEVESKEGVGSTFTLILPAKRGTR